MSEKERKMKIDFILTLHLRLFKSNVDRKSLEKLSDQSLIREYEFYQNSFNVYVEYIDS